PSAAPPPPPANEAVFGDLIVFQRTEGPTLHLPATGRLTDIVRRALLHHADQPPREVLSGHTPGGALSESVHLALMPLANVDHRHSDGRLLGFAAVLPRHLPRFGEDRLHLLRALGRLGQSGQITLGQAGVWEIAPVTGVPSLRSLRTGPYVGSHTVWASVT